MFKIFPLIFLAGLAAGHNWIDRNNCVEMRGFRGMYVPCPKQFVAVGLCSSGAGTDCKFTYTILQCCRVMGYQTRKHCLDQKGHYGYDLTCPRTKVVTNVCTSGSGGHCREHAVTRMICCEGHGLNVNRGNCEWRREKNGFLTTCKHNQVMVGACASGTYGNCGKGLWTGVYCCEVKMKRNDDYDYSRMSFNEESKNNAQIVSITSPNMKGDDLDDINQEQVEEIDTVFKETEE